MASQVSSNTPDTDLWLERSRLAGMLLGGISYGIFLLLTIQATLALLHSRRGSKQQQIILLAYIAVTFILATLGFAGNASYTQTIWIDQRDIPGGPPVLIISELNFWINRMALSCYYVMEWFMSALLLFRLFVVWNRNIFVMTFMTALFLGSVAMAILVLVQSRITDFYDINVQIAYLSLTVGTNILYTLLIIFRILSMHGAVSQFLGKDHAQTYVSIAAMIIESAAMYSVLGVLYIASFATHSNCSNLIFLSISHVQGIAQLLIILRVVEGKAYTSVGAGDDRGVERSGIPNSAIVFGAREDDTTTTEAPSHDTGEVQRSVMTTWGTNSTLTKGKASSVTLNTRGSQTSSEKKKITSSGI